jgi:uncharacterized protein
MAQFPSPCIGVCKFRRPGTVADHCIGCSMTKPQKSLWKGLSKKKAQAAFLDMLQHQQADMGKYSHWDRAYGRKLKKRGMTIG